jgi:hypothetical protein
VGEDSVGCFEQSWLWLTWTVCDLAFEIGGRLESRIVETLDYPCGFFLSFCFFKSPYIFLKILG